MATLHVNLGSLTNDRHKIHISTCRYMEVKLSVPITPRSPQLDTVLTAAQHRANDNDLCCDKERNHKKEDFSLCKYCLKVENGQVRKAES